MKKLILIFSSLLISLGLFAQGDIGLTTNGTYRAYTGTAADTIKATGNVTKTIKIDKDYLYYYEVLLDIDTLSGGGSNSVSCILYGSNDNVNYSSITDETFAATADAIIRYTNLSATGTETIAAFTMYADSTTNDSIRYAYPQITNTVPSENGVMWRYLRLVCTGDGASAYSELQAIRVKIVKVP